jgi:hypothetical protein
MDEKAAVVAIEEALDQVKAGGPVDDCLIAALLGSEVEVDWVDGGPVPNYLLDRCRACGASEPVE